MPSSDHAKKAKYVCEKCGVTFGRRDSLQHHVRTVCCRSSRISSSSRSHKETTTYTCKKCERNFNKRDHLTRHAGTVYTDVNEPSLQKRSKWEDTTTHPLDTEEDPIESPARLPFSDTLSTELLDVVREYWSTIRTRVGAPSKIMFQKQTYSFKINLSYGFFLRNKNTG